MLSQFLCSNKISTPYFTEYQPVGVGFYYLIVLLYRSYGHFVVLYSNVSDGIMLEGKPHFWIKRAEFSTDRSEYEIRMFPAVHENSRSYKVRYPRRLHMHLPRSMAGVLIPGVCREFACGSAFDSVVEVMPITRHFEPLTGHFGSLIGVNDSVRFIELSLSFDFGGIFTVFSPIIPSQDDVLQKVMPHFGMQLARTVAHLAIMRATGMWCRVEVDYDVGSQGFLSLNDFGVIPH